MASNRDRTTTTSFRQQGGRRKTTTPSVTKPSAKREDVTSKQAIKEVTKKKVNKAVKETVDKVVTTVPKTTPKAQGKTETPQITSVKAEDNKYRSGHGGSPLAPLTQKVVNTAFSQTKPSTAIKGKYNASVKSEDRRAKSKLLREDEEKVILPSEGEADPIFERLYLAEKERSYFNAFHKNSPYYLNVFNNVNTAMQEYIYSDDPEKMSKDMLDWYNEYFVETTVLDEKTGKEISYGYFKMTTPPPPLGKNADGESIDISEDWKAFVMYHQVNADAEMAEANRTNYMWKHAAGQGYDKPDSPLDVIRKSISEDGYFSLNFLQNSWDYIKDYMWNPLIEGEFRTLVLNSLVSIGETMDLFGGGVRAALAAKPFLYGTQHTFEGQEAFVYSGGEETQLRLIALGADKLISMEKYNMVSMHVPGYEDDTLTRDEIIKALKDAGLYDEYLKMKEEFLVFEGTQTVGSNVRAFYTEYDKYFYADTGNPVEDVIIEMFTDPSILIGTVGKGITSSSVKGVARTVLTKAAAKAGVELEEKAFKVLQRSLGKNIFSISTDDLKKKVDSLVDLMDIPDNAMREAFRSTLMSDMYNYVDSATFQVVKGVYNLQKLSDVVDTALLHYSTGFATMRMKYSIKGIKKAVDPIIKARNTKLIQDAMRKFKTMQRSDGKYNPASLDNWLKEDINVNGRVRGSVGSEIRKMANQFKAEMFKMEVSLRKIVAEGADESTFINTANDFIRIMTDNKCKTYSEFKEYLDNLLALNGRSFKGDEHVILDAFSTQLKEIDNMAEALRQKRSADSLKEVKNIAKTSDTAAHNHTAFSHQNKNPYVNYTKHADEINKFYSDDDILLASTISKEMKDSLDRLEFSLTPNSEANDMLAVQAFISEVRSGDFNVVELEEKLHILLRDLHVNDLRFPEKITKDHIEVVTQLRQLYELFDQRTQLVLTKGQEIIQMQLDKSLIWDRSLTDSRMLNVLLQLSDVFSVIDEEFITDVSTEFIGLARNVSELRKNVSQLASFNAFSAKIKGQLSDVQYLSMIQALFGISEMNPAKCFTRNSNRVKEAIRKAELTLYSQYGTESLSLDGFRVQASDFTSDLYSRFGEEVNNPLIQERIKNLLKIGHEDPADDVKVQMFQMILKSDEAVKLYNDESIIRDVFFVDIETTGLNRDACQISSIATKKWVPVSDDMSLSQILDILEDDSTIKRYSVKRPVAELQAEVTDDLLEAVYKNNPHVAPSERRTAYFKKYGYEYRGGELVSEAEVVKGFLGDMDTAYANRNKQLPRVVVHNNNGFDTSFIVSRGNVNKTYFNSFKSSAEFSASTWNSLTHLKEFTQNGVIFTYEQRQALEEAFTVFCKDMRKYSKDMRFIDPAELEKLLYNVRGELANLDAAGKLDLIRDSHTGLEDVLPYALQSDVKKLVQVYDVKVLDEIHAELSSFLRDLWGERATLKNDIITNPFKVSKTGPAVENVLNAFLKDNPELKAAMLGYTKIVSDDDIAKYFSGYLDTPIRHRTFNAMQHFAESIKNDMLFNVKSNTLVTKYVQDYTQFIEWAKGFAYMLSPDSEFKYYAYLKIPETPMERFLMARKMWDDLFSDYFNNVSDEFMRGSKEAYIQREQIKALSKYNMAKDGEHLVVQNPQLTLDIETVMSHEAIMILSNTFGTDHHIFKNVLDPWYPNKFLSPEVEQSIKLTVAFDECKRVDEAMKQIGLRHELAGPAGVKQFRIQNVNSQFYALYETVEQIARDPKVFNMYEEFIEGADNLRRLRCTKQILETFLKSKSLEHTLISHLLYNNHIFCVPVTEQQFMRKFIERLKGSKMKYVNYRIEEGTLFVYLNKNVSPYILNDTAEGLGNSTTMSLKGSGEVYTAPAYSQVELPSLHSVISKSKRSSLNSSQRKLLEKFVDQYRSIEEQINVLTNGESAGSVGIAHTYTRHERFIDSLPMSIKKDMIHRDTTCDARIWHSASFDKSILGGRDNHWRITDWEEADLVKNLQNTLNEVAKQHSATVGYLDEFFGDMSNYRIDRMFDNFENDISLDAIKANDDFTVVICREANTDSGFEVVELALKNEDDFAWAKANNAVFVPYDIYLDMRKVFNEGAINNKTLQVWAKAMAITKIGQLFKPATAIRNLMDGFIKAAGDAGSASDTFKGFYQAYVDIRQYNKVSRLINKNNKLGYYSESYVETLFKSEAFKNQVKMSYEEYAFLSGLFQQGSMGGQSYKIKNIIDTAKRANIINYGLKKVSPDTLNGKRAIKEAYDMIGDTITRFRDLGESEIRSLVEANRELFNGKSITEEVFMDYILRGTKLPNQEWLEMNDIMSKLIEIRGKKNMGTLATFNSWLDNVSSLALTLNSQAESIIRLGEYYTLQQQGYTKNQIFKKIAKSQFDYDIKSSKLKMLELIIPYFTFEVNNMAYWIRQLDENPKLLRYLEKIWGEFSYDAAFERYDSEDPYNNRGLEYMVTSGGLAISNSGLYLKANPSVYSALQNIYGGPQALIDKLATPIQYLARHSLKAMGGDYWTILNEVDLDFSDESFGDAVMRSLPFVSTAYSHWVDKVPKQQWKNVVNNDTHTIMAWAMPYTFGVISRYHSDEKEIIAEVLEPYIADGIITEDELQKVSWNSFLADLESQGKWYDKNWGRIVPLSEKNSVGLNGEFDFENDPTAWDRYCKYQKLYKGKYWDNNQRRFVTMAEYIPGMLNREFDFDENPEDWDELCYYNEELFGTKWDNNQGTFVTAENYIEGGLNADDLTFYELCQLKYAIHGETWSEAEHKFIKTHQPMVVFDMGNVKEVDPSTIMIRQEDDRSIVDIIFNKLMLGTVAYGATLNEYPKAVPALSNASWVFNNDPANNMNIIQTILSTVEVPGMKNPTTYKRNYTSGVADGYEYKARPYVKDLDYKFKASAISRYGGGFYRYGTPYTGRRDATGIRLATTGKMDYDSYYNYNYNQSYQYKNPVVGVANYPQTKLGIDRYLRLRGDNVLRRLKNRVPANARRFAMNRKVSVKDNLNRMKLAWWDR